MVALYMLQDSSHLLHAVAGTSLQVALKAYSYTALVKVTHLLVNVPFMLMDKKG